VLPLLDNFDADYDLHRQRRQVLYFRTDRNAPRARMIAIDTRKPDAKRTGRP
jgi:prolyl oligopeptidase